jgi:hypothetical protein
MCIDGRRDIKKREAELNRVDNQLAAIEADFAKNLDLLNEEEFKRGNEARREEQAQLQARRDELVASLTAQSQRHGAVAALPAQIHSFLKGVQPLDVRRAKALLQPILKTATVDRERTIELAFRQPRACRTP